MQKQFDDAKKQNQKAVEDLKSKVGDLLGNTKVGQLLSEWYDVLAGHLNSKGTCQSTIVIV